MSGTLKLDLAQFRELEAFATFGSELDKVSQAQLDRGYRLTELFRFRDFLGARPSAGPAPEAYKLPAPHFVQRARANRD